MKYTVWHGHEAQSKRRFVAGTREKLIKKIAAVCPDPKVLREFHVWKSIFNPSADWIHGAMEVAGTEGLTNLALLKGDNYERVDGTACRCYFARNKCMDIVIEERTRAAGEVEASVQEDSTNG